MDIETLGNLFTKIEKGYKLLSIENGRFYSAFVWNGKIEYILDKWVTPIKGCGPLMVYEDAYDARKARKAIPKHYMDKFAIFPCLYIPSKETRFWNRYRDSWGKLPKGTVLADEVKIVEWKNE